MLPRVGLKDLVQLEMFYTFAYKGQNLYINAWKSVKNKQLKYTIPRNKHKKARRAIDSINLS